MEWEIIDSGLGTAQQHMARDKELLGNLCYKQKPLLHFYEWEGDSATYGHFINPFLYLNELKVKEHKLSLAKRPTGGGIIFHMTDFAFSVLVPVSHPNFSLNTLENYAFVNLKVIQAISQFSGTKELQLLTRDPHPLDAASQHFCMAKPTQYDVMLNGRKVGGAAQRRTKQGYLHQGSISLALPPEKYLAEILMPGTKVLEAMQQHSDCLLGSHYTTKDLLDARLEMRKLIKKNFTI